MGVSDPSFLGLIGCKVRSWIADLSWISCGVYGLSSGEMDDQSFCHDCRSALALPGSSGHYCRSCGRIFCSECMCSSSQGDCWKYPQEEDAFRMELCKFCSQAVVGNGEVGYAFKKTWDQAMPLGESLNHEGRNLVDAHRNGPLHLECSIKRDSEDDDDNEYAKSLLSPSSVFSHDISDLDCSFSIGTDFYNFKSSPLDSPNRIDRQAASTPTSYEKPIISDQDAASYVTTPRSEMGSESMENPGNYVENGGPFFHYARNFENLEGENDIWIPPAPRDAADDMEFGFFRFDDDEDAGGAGHVIKSCSFDDCASVFKKPNDNQKELLRDTVHKHFRDLVSQMLADEHLCVENTDEKPNWLRIVCSLAWQAAYFVKPDTSREGSMDPSDYVKVKCLPTGCPSDSFLVKGIVCTRNVRHKRMVTHHKNPRILIIGGELDLQKPHKLASMNTLICDQKSNYLDMAFSKIVPPPNVLLVEKSVSPDAAQYMLSKGISLVTNVKRTLLKRIAKCTGAWITESIEDFPSTRVGSCESFYVSRVSEECLSGNSANRKPSKTLMFFDGCPRRLGCTVILKGANLEELKKVKRVIHFATFAAYHLSLETSFLADEGATLNSMQPRNSLSGVNSPASGNDLNSLPLDVPILKEDGLSIDHCQESGASAKLSSSFGSSLNVACLCCNFGKTALDLPPGHGRVCSKPDSAKEASQFSKIHPMESPVKDTGNRFGNGMLETCPGIAGMDRCTEWDQKSVKVSGNLARNEFSTTEKNQSILVSLSTSCKGMICGRSQLLRIKFYGNFDKPLGRYLHENLFDKASSCESCREPMDSHVFCYTQQHGSVIINVKRLSNTRLPGEHDGRIWMWHRCLKCAGKDGIPPAAKRVVMSNPAWGLSFGKFLELSFSTHATANRLASCGHSLQRDCLRFYGWGNMVACFRYAPVDILSVCLPPPVLDFSSQLQQKWLQEMTENVSSEMKILHEKVLELLGSMEQRIQISEFQSLRESLLNHVSDLKDLLMQERSSYDALLHPVTCKSNEASKKCSDILELNCIRRSLLIDSYMWDRRFFHLDSMLKAKNCEPNANSLDTKNLAKKSSPPSKDGKSDFSTQKMERSAVSDVAVGVDVPSKGLLLSGSHSTESISDKIDLAWTGGSDPETIAVDGLYGLEFQKIVHPQRFYSFNSTLEAHELSQRFSSDARQLCSFNTLAYEDFGASQAAIQNIQKVPLKSSRDIQNLKFLFGSSPSFIPPVSCMVTDGARLLLQQPDHSDAFVAVYDDEPSSIISYAVSSREHADFVSLASDKYLRRNSNSKVNEDLLGCQNNGLSYLPKAKSFDYDEVPSRLVKSAEFLLSHRSSVSDPKQSHFRFVFDDESSFPSNKARFSVTCYFAKQFFALREICCPSEVDFIRSLSRCRKWAAEGGKSNAYFARSLDERFIIKQVTRTEMDSFEEFAPQYFSYLTESIKTGSPTCLAKILGMFQLTVKHMKGGREVKTDLMVMENLFYERNISRVYDLKGSSRSRYISNVTGNKKVLLDSNLVEMLQTKPIFLGSKAKRKLERAVWNDTAFLASIDVMDYSLLVGIDEEKKELVIGIIDFMRQYTWDKHLETWVKTSGILGGSKNAAPTIVSPKQYKKRFRKAMSSYFLTVPDQWPS